MKDHEQWNFEVLPDQEDWSWVVITAPLGGKRYSLSAEGALVVAERLRAASESCQETNSSVATR